MMLHKVSDTVGGKIKVVASSKTYAYETVVKMFPFCQCKPLLLNSALVYTYRITILLKTSNHGTMLQSTKFSYSVS